MMSLPCRQAIRTVLSTGLLYGALFAPVLTQAGGTATVRVPLVVCDTSSGGGPITPAPLPPSVTLPAADQGLEVYSVVGGSFQLLAPRVLSCDGSVGADGTTSLELVPVAHPWVSPSKTFSEGISATVYPACYGCMLDLACPFFPEAEKLYRAAYPSIPCAAQPRGQSVVRLGADAVAFSDPAGEEVPKSDYLVPDDSPYPTNGVVLFYKIPTYNVVGGHRRFAGDYWHAMYAVCVLPANQHSTCTKALNEFVASRGVIA